MCKAVTRNEHNVHFDNDATRQPCFRLAAAHGCSQSMQLVRPHTVNNWLNCVRPCVLTYISLLTCYGCAIAIICYSFHPLRSDALFSNALGFEDLFSFIHSFIYIRQHGPGFYVLEVDFNVYYCMSFMSQTCFWKRVELCEAHRPTWIYRCVHTYRSYGEGALMPADLNPITKHLHCYSSAEWSVFHGICFNTDYIYSIRPTYRYIQGVPKKRTP